MYNKRISVSVKIQASNLYMGATIVADSLEVIKSNN